MQVSAFTLRFIIISLIITSLAACGGGETISGDSSNSESVDANNADQSTAIQSFTEAEQKDIDALIKDYILENPEILIEAVQRHAEEQQRLAAENARTAIAKNLDELLDPKTGYVTGKNESNAKVAVIEFYDYNCGFCKRATPLISDILKKDEDVKIALRELPIFGEDSQYAAQLSLASISTEKFFDFHVAMMSTSGRVTKDLAKQLAEQNGLSVKALEAEVASGSVTAAISINQRIAGEMNIEGTPAFIIATLDGEFIRAIAGFDPQQILSAISEAKKAANAG